MNFIFNSVTRVLKSTLKIEQISSLIKKILV